MDFYILPSLFLFVAKAKFFIYIFRILSNGQDKRGKIHFIECSKMSKTVSYLSVVAVILGH